MYAWKRRRCATRSSGVPIARHFAMSMNWMRTSSWSSLASPASKRTSVPSSCTTIVPGFMSSCTKPSSKHILNMHIRTVAARARRGRGEGAAALRRHGREQRVDLRAPNERHRQQALSRELLVDLGKRDVGPSREVSAEPRVVPGLQSQIGLLVDRLDEVLGVSDGIVEPPRGTQREQPRRTEQDRLVPLDLAADTGPQHLDTRTDARLAGGSPRTPHAPTMFQVATTCSQGWHRRRTARAVPML